MLCAFDLIELDGFDLRQKPLEDRKSSLAELVHEVGDGIALTSISRERPPQFLSTASCRNGSERFTAGAAGFFNFGLQSTRPAR